ncbi:hypothetical protein X749_25230 [Mesorhizobium sp. LNJC391B00]|nr:hypothetical protein X749_25230 [Mesorhizobium sp. LNJC391B00]
MMSIKLPFAAVANCLMACRSVEPGLSWERPATPCSAVYGGSRRSCLRICLKGGACRRKATI